MKKHLLFFSGMGTILIVLTIVQAVIANSMSTVGVDISGMQNEILVYKKENALLKETLLTRSSLTQIASQIEKSGYETAKTQISLSSSSKLAHR